MHWVIASSNVGKVAEFQEILGPVLQARCIKLQSLAEIGFRDEIPETGTTFHQNALLKAKAISEFSHSPVLSDDSGLEVEALNGAPGVFTARYAGVGASNEANRTKLLRELELLGALKLETRRARFVCVLCWLEPGKQPQFFEGKCEGSIALAERGQAGFGYDPLFIPEVFSQTFAELPGSVKHALSHRGHAIQQFLNAIRLDSQ
jgi:XTP/dITP diphosphohydrolase